VPRDFGAFEHLEQLRLVGVKPREQAVEHGTHSSAAIAEASSNGTGHGSGPKPGEPGCRAPAEVLRERGFRP
jgi:hypothetical protein